MPDIPIPRKLSVTLCGFIIDLHLACVTSKNCWQQEVLPSVTDPLETGVINSAKGIVAKLGKTEGNYVIAGILMRYFWFVIFVAQTLSLI